MYDKIRRITGDSGNDRRGLNMPLIRNIEILLPPITEQENIIFKLETAINKLDIVNKAVNEVINNYKALKSAILSQELQPSEAA
jgi:type I restriction enzyme S subunit